MTGLVAALLLLGATTVFAAMSPNYATNSHEDMSIYYYGYVQCQPSYVEMETTLRAVTSVIGVMIYREIL